MVSQQINMMFPKMIPCGYLMEYKKKLRERLRTEEQLRLQHEHKNKVENRTYSNPEENLKPLKPILKNLNAAVQDLNTFTKRLNKMKVKPKVLKEFQENLRKIKRDVNKISI
ncbi:uncharacterized protein LOC106668860 isoform X2 [Cimex lectularius]|nr:uncharacterized protein LOC106668860 isoform X2 [Cimex lectularius]XP_014253494.1 uncharacterized protein LOC106668860 isoform X2 [Cimex lectularius]